MVFSPRGRRRLLVLAAVTVVLAGCGGSVDTPEREETAGPAVYSVRGVVREVRQMGESNFQLSVYHEEIPGFVGITGDVVGMKSMTMPFSVDPAVDLTAIEAGTKIDFELSVDWSRPEPGLITAIGVLPEDTELKLGAD